MRIRVALLTATVLYGFASLASAQSSDSLLVPGQAVARDVPGAKMLPDPAKTYKVVFDVGVGAKNVDDVNPMLAGMAEYVNTLGKYGVPREHRKIAAVFHRGGTDIIVNNETFKATHDGHDNPNIALIKSLAAAGVEFHVCGQAVMGRKIDPKTILPEIELDLWALVTMVELQQEGYVKVGGG